ncbi:MAG: hypothetical protein JWQ89_2810 [Devosia sp.]|nr:hypothetical protein [Devosia sp.]
MEPDWRPIQAAYQDTTESLDGLAERFGVSRSAISWRARRHGWVMRNRPAGTSGPSLINRIYRLLERQLVQMERAEGTMSEKDAATLVRMATAVDRLIEAESKAPRKPPRNAAHESTEMQEIRKTIARRLEQLGDF